MSAYLRRSLDSGHSVFHQNSSEERPTEARCRPGNPRLLGMVLPIIVHARSYSGPPAQKHYGQIRASLSTR